MKAKPEPNPFLEWALFYARDKHWPVFPVTPGAKKPPLVEHGLLDATLNEATIRGWWMKWPNANVAIRTGVECIVTDEDRDHGGIETMEGLCHRHGSLPDTLEAITPHLGRHRYWSKPGVHIPTRAPARDDWPGVDVRGEGGYVLVHPSMVDGRRYEWDGADGELGAVRAAPDWLIEALSEGAKNGGANGGGKTGFRMGEKIKAGQRNDQLFRYASAMRRARGEYADILAALLKVNETRCEPPLSPSEVEKIAASVCGRYPAGEGAPAADEARRTVLPEPLTVDGLLDKDIALPEPLIEHLLPRRGLALMVGAQRSGKTVFAAQVAIALATARSLLDYYRLLAHGPVIVMEKDDPGGDATFKDLYVRARVPRGTPIHYYGPDRIPIPLGAGFCEWLEIIIPKLGAVAVVLDSYTALRPARKTGGDIVLEERREIAELDALGKRLSVLILMLHHESITTRSNNALDWDARGAGTFGMTMATECQIAITRYRELGIGAPERLLRFRSRHTKEHQVTLRYTEESGLFEHVIDGEAAPLYHLIHEIRRQVRAQTFTAKDVEETLGISRPTVFRHLALLVAAGVLWRNRAEGTYRFAPEIEQLKF